MQPRRFSAIQKWLRTVREDKRGDQVSDFELLHAFTSRADEECFLEIIRRHGPTVMQVCQALLRSETDAEDAFQATFLVLAQKARSIQKAGSLNSWLYGVAHRIAKKSQARHAIRRKHETSVQRQEVLPDDQVSWREVQAAVHQELNRLPHHLQEPLILCYLEGKTQDAAALILGLAKGTLRGRLERGRALLRTRLIKRGLAPAAVLAAAAWPAARSSTCVPPTLVAATLSSASLMITKETLTAIVSPAVNHLMQGELRSMFLDKIKAVTGALALASVMSLGVVVYARGPVQSPADPQDSSKVSAVHDQKRNAGEQKAKQGRLRGRFMSKDTGKPVAGVILEVVINGVPDKASCLEVQSDADGRYELSVPIGQGEYFGVLCPAGFYTQDDKTHGPFATTLDQPVLERDFVLLRGSTWHVELRGFKIEPAYPPTFMALPNRPQRSYRPAEVIFVRRDSEGKAVLTVPRDGGRWTFYPGFQSLPYPYQAPSAKLVIENDFDPSQIGRPPERIQDKKVVRLTDRQGRTAEITEAKGLDIAVENGKPRLRFEFRFLKDTAPIVLRGSVVDEEGKPIAGAKLTPTFWFDNVRTFQGREAKSNSLGNFELEDVFVEPKGLKPDSRVGMIVVRKGFVGTEAAGLKLVDFQKSGQGDFGKIVLRRGHTLTGRVIDSNGRPIQGALITNSTDIFLYDRLRCRTGDNGEFTMPDLPYGLHVIDVQLGNRGAKEQFQFDAKNDFCIITLKPAE